MVENNGWAEHKALVEWRLAKNEADLKTVDDKLSDVAQNVNTILQTLSSMQGAKKARQWAQGIWVPAVVAFLVVVAEKVLATMLK